MKLEDAIHRILVFIGLGALVFIFLLGMAKMITIRMSVQSPRSEYGPWIPINPRPKD